MGFLDTSKPFLYHGLLALSSLLLSSLLRLPSLPLLYLHTYIHPDHLPSSSTSVALRPPSSRSKAAADPFSSPSSQLLRLSLTPSLLPSRPFFPLLRLSLLLSSASLLLLFLPLPPSPLPFLSASLSSLLSLHSLLSSSLEPSASRRSERSLAALSAALSFALTLSILRIPLLSLLCGALAGSLLLPAVRAGRAFWVGTDQLRTGLDVVHCGPVGRGVLLAGLTVNCAASAVWVGPAADVVARTGSLEKVKVWMVAAAALAQLAAVRMNAQMHLNEGVLAWYQRLHGGKVPDLDYGRAKVFLHDHYVCLVALQFVVPPVLVLMLVGVSRLDDAFFDMLWIDGGSWSSSVRDASLFLAWWIVFVWTVFTMCTVALLRRGVLVIS